MAGVQPAEVGGVGRGKEPFVKLQPLPKALKKRVAGGKKGFMKSIAPDFDDPVEEFDPFMS